MTEWRKEEIFIVGKTYPTPHERYLDTVCTGGVTGDGEWIRLYPISFRYLEGDQQYHMYSWMRAEVRRNRRDRRLATHEVNESSIIVIEEVKDWRERRRILLPLLDPHLEDLESRNQEDPSVVSMGLVEIEYIEFYWEKTDRQWNPEQLAYMRQIELIGPKRKPLEKIPYKLRLKFRCKGNPACKGHDKGLFAWEYSEAFRKFRARY